MIPHHFLLLQNITSAHDKHGMDIIDNNLIKKSGGG